MFTLYLHIQLHINIYLSHTHTHSYYTSRWGSGRTWETGKGICVAQPSHHFQAHSHVPECLSSLRLPPAWQLPMKLKFLGGKKKNIKVPQTVTFTKYHVLCLYLGAFSCIPSSGAPCSLMVPTGIPSSLRSGVLVSSAQRTHLDWSNHLTIPFHVLWHWSPRSFSGMCFLCTYFCCLSPPLW